MQLYQDECGLDTRWDRHLVGKLVTLSSVIGFAEISSQLSRTFARVSQVRVPQARVPATLPVSCTVTLTYIY